MTSFAGMYLTGTVLCSRSTCSGYSGGEEKESFRAYVQFDRGCITTTKCSCGEQNWCRHVLALCLARLDESAPLQLHPPISETLTNLNRDQLQKLVQYFLEKLPLEGVAAIQEIASGLLDKGSEINKIPGAPGEHVLAFCLTTLSVHLPTNCGLLHAVIICMNIPTACRLCPLPANMLTQDERVVLSFCVLP